MIRKYLRTRGPTAVVLGVLTFLTGCAADAELDTLNPQGPSARSIDNLFDPVFYVAVVVFIFVFAGTFIIWWRFRDDHDDEEFPHQFHGDTRLELAWTIVPTLILVVISVFTLITLRGLNETEANAVTIEVDGTATQWEPEVVVVGQQWWWEFRYYLNGLDGVDLTDARHLPPADIVTTNQMVIPAGEEIELAVTSRDVIHSCWIPALNGKKDAAPGRVHPWKLEADEPGVYFGQCTEFCGLSHSRMRMQVVAVTLDDFAAWVAEQLQPAAEPQAAAAQRGMEIYQSQCARCHVVDGFNDNDGADLVANAAPNLTHLMSRTTYAGGIFNMYEPDGSLDRTQLEAWLRNSPAEKPAYAEGRRGMPAMGLDEGQIDDVVAYLTTLGRAPSLDVIVATEVE